MFYCSKFIAAILLHEQIFLLQNHYSFIESMSLIILILMVPISSSVILHMLKLIQP